MSIKTVALKEEVGHLDLDPPPLVVEESASYGEVLGKMRRSNQGSAIVCRKGVIAGVFTDRDILNKYALEKPSLKTPIGKLMTAKPVTIRPSATIGKAIETMHAKRVRNLPLTDSKGRPKGLLTVGCIIRYLADHFPAEVVNLPPTLNQVISETEGA